MDPYILLREITEVYVMVIFNSLEEHWFYYARGMMSLVFSGPAVIPFPDTKHVTTVVNGHLTLNEGCKVTTVEGSHCLYALLQLVAESKVDWAFNPICTYTTSSWGNSFSCEAMKLRNITIETTEIIKDEMACI